MPSTALSDHDTGRGHAPLAIDARNVPLWTDGAISRTRGYELMRAGRLPFKQLGRKRLVLMADLVALLESL